MLNKVLVFLVVLIVLSILYKFIEKKRENFNNPGQYQLFCKDGRGNFGGSLEYPSFSRTGTCDQCL
jgi:hypothetical protein